MLKHSSQFYARQLYRLFRNGHFLTPMIIIFLIAMSRQIEGGALVAGCQRCCVSLIKTLPVVRRLKGRLEQVQSL